MIVDHDETDEALARLPIGNIFAPGILTRCGNPSCPWILPGASRCIGCLPGRLTTHSHHLASAMEAVAKSDEPSGNWAKMALALLAAAKSFSC